jgi:hypothetical protein
MDTDGPRFGEPAMDRFAPEIADALAVNLKTATAIRSVLIAARQERFRAEAPGRRRDS